MESAHAKTEGVVSGPYLGSSGKSMEWISKGRNFYKSERNFDSEILSKMREKRNLDSK